MEPVKVSVVVPVYNGERYLKRVMDSLRNQTLRETEIICIDDGSTDASGEMLERYAEQDRRIRVFHQENKGPSGARNVGIVHATGEYVGFVDCDDWIDEDYYEKLYNAAKRYDADMACAAIMRHRRWSTRVGDRYEEERLYTDSRDIFIRGGLRSSLSACRRIVKRELTERIPFREGWQAEDTLWISMALKQTNRLVVVPHTYYHYPKNPNSRSTGRWTEERLRQTYWVAKWHNNFCEKQGIALKKQDRRYLKKVRYIGSFAWLKIKEYKGKDIWYLCGRIPFYRQKAKDMEKI